MKKINITVFVLLISFYAFSLPQASLHRNSIQDVLGIERFNSSELTKNIESFNTLIDKIPDRLNQQNIKISGNHRNWAHWGLNTSIPKEFLEKYSDKEKEILIDTWRKINIDLENEVIKTFNIPKGKQSKALTNIIYSIHILDDYLDKEIYSLQDLDSLVKNLEKSVQDFYGKNSEKAIKFSEDLKNELLNKNDLKDKVKLIKSKLSQLNISESLENQLTKSGVKLKKNLSLFDIAIIKSQLMIDYNKVIYEDGAIKYPLDSSGLDEDIIKKMRNQPKLIDRNNNLLLSEDMKKNYPEISDEFFKKFKGNLSDDIKKRGFSKKQMNELTEYFVKDIEKNPKNIKKNINIINNTKSLKEAFGTGVAMSLFRNLDGIIDVINGEDLKMETLSKLAIDTAGYGGSSFVISGLLLKGAKKSAIIGNLQALGMADDFAMIAFDGIKLGYGFITGKGDMKELKKNLRESTKGALTWFTSQQILLFVGVSSGGILYVGGVMVGSVVIDFGIEFVLDKVKSFNEEKYVLYEDVVHLFPKGFLERTNNFFNLPEKTTFENMTNKTTFDNISEKQTFDNLPKKLIFEEVERY